MTEDAKSTVKNQESALVVRSNRFANYRPSLARNVLLLALRGAMKTLGRLEKVDWENVPSNGPVIMMINHVSFLDAVVLTGIFPRPLISMAKAEAMDDKLSGPLLRIFDAFPVNRGTGDRQALRTAFDVVDAGLALLIAPEGHRGESGALGEAHEGIAYVASRAHVPIVPVGITGTDRFKYHLKRLELTHAVYRFGRPFYVEAEKDRASGRVLRLMTDEVMYQLAALLPPEQRGLYSDLEIATTRYLRFVSGSNLPKSRNFG